MPAFAVTAVRARERAVAGVTNALPGRLLAPTALDAVRLALAHAAGVLT